MEYGLIGEKLGHSFSKPIHERLADYKYDLVPLTKDEFKEFMESRDFKAINVTIPYKCDVIPYLDEIDEHAKNIGAVNTIVNNNGKLTGYNTDFAGFLYSIKHNKILIEGKKVVVLGYGGGARAITSVLDYLNAGEIVIVKKTAEEIAISYEECFEKHSDATIIVNTSPVGMYPNTNAKPVDLSLFPQCEAVIDIIYNPLKTKLLLQAEELGLKAVNGLEMLVAQAKYAVEHFLGKDINDKVIDEIYKELIDPNFKNLENEDE